MPAYRPVIATFACLLLAHPVASAGAGPSAPSRGGPPHAGWEHPQATAAPAAGPLEVIRQSNVRVMRILRPGHTITAADRVQVLELLQEATDFAAVSENVMGPRWASMPATERAEFTAAFAALVSATSIAKMGRYRADRFEYLAETVTGDRAAVRTRAYYQGRGVSLDYELALAGGRWRIVNYALNGVDNGRSYRRQFDKILEKDTVAALIARLRKKVAEIEAGAGS